MLLMVGAAFVTSGSDAIRPVVVETNTPIVGTNHLTAEALYVEGTGGKIWTLISLGERVPSNAHVIVTTSADLDTQITVRLFRGTNYVAAQDYSLGQFQIVGIAPAPKGSPRVELSLTVTEQVILVSARDWTNKVPYAIRRAIEKAKP